MDNFPTAGNTPCGNYPDRYPHDLYAPTTHNIRAVCHAEKISSHLDKHAVQPPERIDQGGRGGCGYAPKRRNSAWESKCFTESVNVDLIQQLTDNGTNLELIVADFVIVSFITCSMVSKS